MIKKYSLIFLFLLSFTGIGFGQIVTFDFNGLAGDEATVDADYNETGLNTTTISRGAGINPAGNGDRFNAVHWELGDVATAVSGDSYMEFTLSPNPNYSFDVTSIDVIFQRSGTGPRGIALRSSLDGYATNIDAEKAIVDNSNSQPFTFNVGQTNNTTAVTYRIYGWAEATTGSGGFEGPGNDIVVNGSVTLTSTDEVDWCNLQFPGSGTITFGGAYDVYAQVYEAGLTDSAGQAAGITAWIGYNTSNINPNDASWTWIPATYNVDSGNNDEYRADIGSIIPTSGTYYYASRFQLNGGPFRYGGYNAGGGGFWDGTTNVNGALTLTADQVNFCNVDYPKTATITEGDAFTVYAQAYEPGVTDSPGQGANVLAWIGYTTLGVNHQPWDDTGWTWIPATYDSDFGNNDQYTAEIGSALADGTYYFASRFQLNGSDYSY